jgi:peptidoglycan/xylan/chitin deacetylase (PgdA/CDA1 family)
MAILLPPRLIRLLSPRSTSIMSLLVKGGILFLVVFFLVSYIIYKPPPQVIAALAAQYPDVLWRVDGLPALPKLIALTIDDAPSSETEGILKVLAKYKAKATFFVIGSQVKTDKDREILVEIVRHGHELGNHAMHDEPAVSLETTTLVEEIHKVHDILTQAYRSAAAVVASGAGENSLAGLTHTTPPLYFRPGSGFFNTKMRNALANLGYKLVLGDVYPHDPQIHNANINSRHILSMSRPGSVIICHDRRPWTAPMLEAVLKQLVGVQSYKVTTVSGLLEASGKVHKPDAKPDAKAAIAEDAASNSVPQQPSVNAMTPQSDKKVDDEVAGYHSGVDDVRQVMRHHKDKWRPLVAAQRDEEEKKKNQKSTAGWLLGKIGLQV